MDSKKIEQLLENILTEIKTHNKNKEKDELEKLTSLSLTLSSLAQLRNDIRDTKWNSFKEKDEAEKAFIKLSEIITKRILKLAPSIKE